MEFQPIPSKGNEAGNSGAESLSPLSASFGRLITMFSLNGLYLFFLPCSCVFLCLIETCYIFLASSLHIMVMKEILELVINNLCYIYVFAAEFV